MRLIVGVSAILLGEVPNNLTNKKHTHNKNFIFGMHHPPFDLIYFYIKVIDICSVIIKEE